MKKLLKKHGVTGNRVDFPKTGRHIHFLRILAFASEGINFTEKEDAHFDICRSCRLKVIVALRNLSPLVAPITTMAKAA
jgi:hypothetical protein